jgi:hypothetical protein
MEIAVNAPLQASSHFRQASRLSSIGVSEILKITGLATDLKRQGKDAGRPPHQEERHHPRRAQEPCPRAMPRGTVSHYRRAVVARALPLDSARIVMWNIGAKNAHGRVI